MQASEQEPGKKKMLEPLEVHLFVCLVNVSLIQPLSLYSPAFVWQFCLNTLHPS